MRIISLLIILFIGFNGYTQKLNKLGKIVVDEIPKALDYVRIKSDDIYQIVYKDSFTFEGNEFYKLTNAFIANDETADNKPDKISYYGIDGKLKVSIITPRIINFKTSMICTGTQLINNGTPRLRFNLDKEELEIISFPRDIDLGILSPREVIVRP